jgi:hypothetical protein
MLGNNHVARCDFVWRQSGLKRHLPGRLPDNGDDSASLRSYVVELVPKSYRLITDRIDGVSLASHGDPSFGLTIYWIAGKPGSPSKSTSP